MANKKIIYLFFPRFFFDAGQELAAYIVALDHQDAIGSDLAVENGTVSVLCVGRVWSNWWDLIRDGFVEKLRGNIARSRSNYLNCQFWPSTHKVVNQIQPAALPRSEAGAVEDRRRGGARRRLRVRGGRRAKDRINRIECLGALDSRSGPTTTIGHGSAGRHPSPVRKQET